MLQTQIQVDWGKISLSWDQSGIRFLSLPEENEKLLSGTQEDAGEIEAVLKAYFQGKPINFSFKTNLTGYSSFQQEVWEAVKSIPYGETRSYHWVAKQIDNPKASRAVGGAMGKNPIAVLIP